MRKNWVSLAGFLALAVSQTGYRTYGDDAATAEPTPASSAEAAPTPLGVTTNKLEAAPTGPVSQIVESDALGFWTVGSDGQATNAAQTTVRVVRSGRIVQTRQVGQGGVAQISKLSPGPYSIMASGPEGFAAFGAYLGDPAGTAVSRVGLVPQRDAQLVRSLIRTHLAAGSVAEATPSTKEITRLSAEENSAFEIQADGSIKGQIIRAAADGQRIEPIANLFVAFVRDGQVVGEATSDANGEFTVSGLTAGIHSLAIAGPGGFAALSTELIQAEPLAQGKVKQFQFVAFQSGGGSTIVPATPDDARLLNQSPGQGPNEMGPPGMAGMAAPGYGGGGAGGGTGGGGGGFGGGGLLGAALGAAGGALAGALINDNNNNPPPTPAAP